MGLWGYMEMLREAQEQQRRFGLAPFHHIVVACGSGGTVAGLAVACRLQQLQLQQQQEEEEEAMPVESVGNSSGSGGSSTHVRHVVPIVHGVCVCDSPDYFFEHIRTVSAAAGLDVTPLTVPAGGGSDGSGGNGGGGAGPVSATDSTTAPIPSDRVVADGRPALGDPTEWPLRLYQGKGLGCVARASTGRHVCGNVCLRVRERVLTCVCMYVCIVCACVCLCRVRV